MHKFGEQFQTKNVSKRIFILLNLLYFNNIQVWKEWRNSWSEEEGNERSEIKLSLIKSSSATFSTPRFPYPEYFAKCYPAYLFSIRSSLLRAFHTRLYRRDYVSFAVNYPSLGLWQTRTIIVEIEFHPSNVASARVVLFFKLVQFILRWINFPYLPLI